MPEETARKVIEVPMSERAAYTPAEFAALFGRKETWGYRRIYDGTVKTIEIGRRIMIARSEVERIQKGNSASEESGKRTRKDTDDIPAGKRRQRFA